MEGPRVATVGGPRAPSVGLGQSWAQSLRNEWTDHAVVSWVSWAPRLSPAETGSEQEPQHAGSARPVPQAGLWPKALGSHG